MNRRIPGAIRSSTRDVGLMFRMDTLRLRREIRWRFVQHRGPALGEGAGCRVTGNARRRSTRSA